MNTDTHLRILFGHINSRTPLIQHLHDQLTPSRYLGAPANPAAHACIPAEEKLIKEILIRGLTAPVDRSSGKRRRSSTTMLCDGQPRTKGQRGSPRHTPTCSPIDPATHQPADPSNFPLDRGPSALSCCAEKRRPEVLGDDVLDDCDRQEEQRHDVEPGPMARSKSRAV